MKKSKNIFGLKSLFIMTSSQIKINKNFRKILTRSNLLTFSRRSWDIAKLFLLGRGIDVTSRGERLLSRSIATMLKDGSVATV